MRIAIIGAQNTGKTTLFNAFKAHWPMYASPEKTYRELIKEKNLTINESGTMESQEVIRDIMVDLALANTKGSKVIHDRCILDNLAYTLWLYDYNKLGKDKKKIDGFIATTIHMARESLKFYDIIFWLPVNPNITLEEKENRSESLQYREEIDNIFYGIHENYKRNTGLVFDKEDQPTLIVLEGELDQKIEKIKEYLNDEGELIETTQSVLGDLETAYDEMALRAQIQK